MSHAEARVFVEFLREPIASGVLRALALIPQHRSPIVTLHSGSPWVTVNQVPGPDYVVWRATGAVYEVDEQGAVGEERVA
jgi:hypothetical protein